MKVCGGQPPVIPPGMTQVIQASVNPARGGQWYYDLVKELESVALPG